MAILVKGCEVGMTIERMIELLEIEHECMLRGAHDNCDRKCADCELVQEDDELHEMYTNVVWLLKEQNDCENCAMAIEDRQMVIRCRDCKYGKLHDYTGYYICMKAFGEKISHRPDWFCADGANPDD